MTILRDIGIVNITSPSGDTRDVTIYEFDTIKYGTIVLTEDQLDVFQTITNHGTFKTGDLIDLMMTPPSFSPRISRWKSLGLASLMLLSGIGCNNGGGTTETIPPDMTQVTFRPTNPIIGKSFSVDLTNILDTGLDDLEFIISKDNGSTSGKGIARPIYIHMDPKKLEGIYKIKITLTNNTGQQFSEEYSFMTNPHSSVISDGSITNTPYARYSSTDFHHMRTYFVNLGFSNHVSDLDKILSVLTPGETLSGFEYTVKPPIMEVGINTTNPTHFTDDDNIKGDDWGGGYPLDPVTANDVNNYMARIIDESTAIAHAGYYRNIDPNNPTKVTNTYQGPIGNPDVLFMTTNTQTTLPGTGTVDVSLQIIYQPNQSGINRVKLISFNPSPSDKLIMQQFLQSTKYDPKVLSLDILDGNDLTKARLDNILYGD